MPTFSSSPVVQHGDAGELALRLAAAEHALRVCTSGQIDGVIDSEGKTYLLHPAQEKLRESENRLDTVLESAADLIMVVNRGGTIVSQNAAVTPLFGYERHALEGTDFFRFLQENDRDRVYVAFFNVIEGLSENATVYFRHPLQNGGHRPVQGTVARLRQASPACVVFILRPWVITDSASPEQTRKPSSLSGDCFLAMLSHELRTPLGPVLLGIDLLLEQARFSEGRPTLSMIRRNINLQCRLLDDLRDFVNVGQHKLRLCMDPIDAHEIIGYIEVICRSELASAQITLELDLGATESFVVADSLRLQQVLWNLVKNAIKFSPPGGGIVITTSNETVGHLMIEVGDKRIGTGEALSPLAFASFQEGAFSALGGKEGVGWELFIAAKAMTEAQGGTLTAHSAGRDHGAIFRLELVSLPYAIPAEVCPD